MPIQKKRRDALCLACLALIVGHLAVSHATLNWWALGVGECASNRDNCNNCEQTNHLTENQESLCRDNGDTELVRALSRGTLQCIRDCQRQFANSPWNCTTFQGGYLFGRFAENGTRETAILNAFLSAGAVHGIASACHENVIDGCACDAKDVFREDGVTFLQSCSDNVAFAIDFVKRFYGLEGAVEERDLVDKWNNELGYQAVNNRTTYCRCTGLSGSCVVQTCYEKAPSVKEIGDKLQPRYMGSQKVTAVDSNDDSHSGLHVVGTTNEPIDNFPCYINDTPDLCSPDVNQGILGTSGRKCDPLGSGPNSCNALCCGGFHQYEFEVEEEDCKFVWCCRIECKKTNTVTVTEYRCN